MPYNNLAMNLEDKKEWVDALRSGNYKQTKDYLKSKTKSSYGYCCLGVFCELKKLPKSYREGVGYFKFPNGSTDSSYPDVDWFSRFFKHINDGRVNQDKVNGIGKHLAALNDQGDTFDAIAEWIENNL